jgi:hypothetical protein
MATAAELRLAKATVELVRLKSEKYQLLSRAADAWDEKSRDWSLAKDVRDAYAARARKARAEAGELAKELGI